MLQKTLFILTILCSYFTGYSIDIGYKNVSSASSFANSLTEITVCEGGTLALTAELVSGAAYQWKTPDNITNKGVDFVRENMSFEMAGTYTLIVTKNNCSNTAIIAVTVAPKANAGGNGTLEVIKGVQPTYQELFNALEGTPDTNGTWKQNTDTSYTYTVTGNTPCGDASATVTLVESKKIVNGFSPNNDNINDTWIIIPDILKRYPKNVLNVYNRYNKKVYSASPYKNDWNGISNGKWVVNARETLPPGPYLYILQLNDNKNTVFKGTVYINY